MKRIISFILAIVLTVALFPHVAVSAAIQQSPYEPYVSIEFGESSSVKCGIIRYISQKTSSKKFYDSYWGSKWKKQAGIECGTSCISMALSYVGINKTPKNILDDGDGLTYFGRGWGGSTYKGYNYSNLATAMDRYIKGNGKYSPPVIHLKDYSKAGHWVVLIGRVDSDTYFVLDPATTTRWQITINGTKATYTHPSSNKKITDTISVGGDDVRQWHNKKATGIKVEIVTQPKSASVFEGKTAKISVSASGQGLTYKWYHKNKGASSFSLASSFTGNYYSTTMSSNTDGRQVYCIVTDKNNNVVTSKTVTLSLAKITTQPKSVTVTAGEKAKTSIKTIGSGLKYQWYYKDPGKTSFTKSSLTGTTYSVTMSSKNDGRQVYCKVTDTAGNSVNSNAATLRTSNVVKSTYSSYCTIKSTAKTYAMSLPCSSGTNKNSTVVESVAKNKTYTATALILNSRGNYWYKVTTSSGKTAYLPSSKMSFVKDLTKEKQDITISGAKAPTTLTVGKAFSIEGTINSNHSDLTKVAAYVYSGKTASGSAVTGGSASVSGDSYSLKGSAVDSKVLFNKLPAGTYTYAVYGYYRNYYAKTEKTRAETTGKICLYTKTFTVKK